MKGVASPGVAGAGRNGPLIQALARPMQALRQTVTMTGREAKRFDCYAVSDPIGTIQLNVAPLYHSYRLIVPLEEAGDTEAEVGSSCRVCPLEDCEGRREPSLLADVG